MADRRLWTQQEDRIIVGLVKQHGCKKWTHVAEEMGKAICGLARSSKQIRERWHNHLNPEINKNPWTEDQQNIIFDAHKKLGSKWKDIAKLLQARTDNSVKNHFYSSLRRSLRRINKYVGLKNSTTQMRKLKPAILSKLIEDSDQNQQSRGINFFLAQHLYKPTTKNPQEQQDCSMNFWQKQFYQQAIDNLIKFNDQFQKIQGRSKISHPNRKKHNKKRNTLNIFSTNIQRNNKHELLTTVEEMSSKQLDHSTENNPTNKCTNQETQKCKEQSKQDVNVKIEQLRGDMSLCGSQVQEVQQNWEESGYKMVAEFPEFEQPEEDHDFMQLVLCRNYQRNQFENFHIQ